jgi:hypothetical protein
MSAWVVNFILLSLLCYGSFIGAIVMTMRAEGKKRSKTGDS